MTMSPSGGENARSAVIGSQPLSGWLKWDSPAKNKVADPFGLSEDRDPTSELLTVLGMTTGKGGETMTARDLIVKADRIRQEMGLSQAEWGRQAGLDEFGKAVGRTYYRGNCKLSTMVMLLRPLGYEIKIMKVEDMP
jgi:hypothetical protein